MDSRELKTRLLELQYAYGDCKIDTRKFNRWFGRPWYLLIQAK